MTKLTDSALGELGAFTYAGSGRRVARTFGGGTVAQSVAGGGGYTGLDRFGRVIDLDYTGGTGMPQRFVYGYTAAGNRAYAQITQGTNTARSYLYLYDALNRLVAAERGEVSVSGGGVASLVRGTTTPEARRWYLDNLGNWTGNGTDARGLIWGADNEDSTPPFIPDANVASIDHAVDKTNAITSITTDGSPSATLDYDLAGNLVSDGTYFLQYDGFNRLVQVNELAWTLGDYDRDGDVDDDDEAAILACVDDDGVAASADCQCFDYDGDNDGRTYESVGDGDVDADDYAVFEACHGDSGVPPTPPDCYHAATVDSTTGQLADGSDRLGPMVVQFVYDGLGRLIRTVRPDRTEDHYYDGVRRIQTDVTPAVGDPATDRQYVYSPDYVDEFVAQIDAGDAQNPDGRVFYMLQDGNYNVVALVNAAGAVVEQYAYRPYGSLVAVDDLGSAPVNTAGHQGLFYERLDGNGLAVGATGFYYNRARYYSPALGRFLQRDPNATGLLSATTKRIDKQLFDTVSMTFDPLRHFSNGINIYGYLRNNPTMWLDPSGKDLFSALAFYGGVAGGSLYAAWALDGPLDSNDVYKIKDGFLLGAITGRPALKWLLKHVTKGPGPTPYEVMKDMAKGQRGGLFGFNFVKMAVMGVAGYNAGSLAYTMYDLFGEDTIGLIGDAIDLIF